MLFRSNQPIALLGVDPVAHQRIVRMDKYLTQGHFDLSGANTVIGIELAKDLGVADRCRWKTGFIPECDVWEFFTVADAVALTYSRDFRSASGVLNVNAQFRKPVLASSGPGPLKTAVGQYQLGEWVSPDSAEALKQGVARLMAIRPDARWSEYLANHSWEENAKRVLCALCANLK